MQTNVASEEAAGTQDQDVLTRLARLLGRAVRRLGEEGPNEEACLMAAEAWSLLRHDYPKEAERFNGLLHYLSSTKCKCRSGRD